MTAFLGWFVRSKVAANVLMLIIIVFGVTVGLGMRRATFPDFTLEIATVSVAYPGATPEDIEASVIRVIEEQLAEVDEIKKLSSTAREGLGTVTIEFKEGSDIQRAMEDVRNQIDAITTFPRDAEEPIVARVEPTDLVAFVLLHGEVREEVLREWAQEVKDRLITEGVTSTVALGGVRNREIHVLIDRARLEEHGIAPERVVAAVQRGSVDVPAGTLHSPGQEYLVRVASQRYEPEDYRSIVVLTAENGSAVTVGDLAEVRWAFEDEPLSMRYNGVPAVQVTVLKSRDADVLRVDERLDAFLAEANGVGDRPGWLPAALELTKTFAWSDLVRDRLQLLTKNGLVGLGLVILVLWFFTSWRISFWVAVGVVTAGLGTLALLGSFDQSINMISMFAMIMSLGILVDDAIIVAENIYARHENGEGPIEAAINGARQVAIPVLAATLTTIAAFLPMTVVPGMMGKFMIVLPITVSAGLAISLIESFVILPHHLLPGMRRAGTGAERRIHPLRARIDRGIAWTSERLVEPMAALAVRWRYAVLAGTVAFALLAVGIIGGGRVPWRFFPQPEGDVLAASLRFPVGTPVEVTQAQAAALEEALREVGAEYAEDQPLGEDGRRLPLVRHVSTMLGALPNPETGLVGETGSHLAGLTVVLLGGELRETSLDVVAERWRELAREKRLPGLRSLAIGPMEGGPGGADIDIRFSGGDWSSLRTVAERLQQALQRINGVENIEDDLVLGKPELRYAVNETGRSLGITNADLGEALRARVFGAEAERFQRGRDEIITRVIAPPSERDGIDDLEELRVPTAANDLAPLPLVADLERIRNVVAIHHYNRQRVVTVTADTTDATSTQEVLDELRAQGLFEELSREHGVRFLFEGVAATQQEAVGGLMKGFVIAITAIYLLLVLSFTSWLQPITIIAVIPVGLVGAVLGHLVMGLPLTIISMFGLIGLAGIAVNDAINLVHYVNGLRAAGQSLPEAVRNGIHRRFRPIVMTTATTVAGLMPILLERSMQAQWLIPMANAISFGLLVATFGTLVVVPALYVVLQDFAAVWRWARTGRGVTEHLREE